MIKHQNNLKALQILKKSIVSDEKSSKNIWKKHFHAKIFFLRIWNTFMFIGFKQFLIIFSELGEKNPQKWWFVYIFWTCFHDFWWIFWHIASDFRIFSKIAQLWTAVTSCILNRSRCSWYLGCVARAASFENGIDNRIL